MSYINYIIKNIQKETGSEKLSSFPNVNRLINGEISM